MNKMFTLWRATLFVCAFLFGTAMSVYSQCDPGETPYEITLASGGSFIGERSWEIVPTDGGDPVISVDCGDYVGGTFEFCLTPGVSYTFNAYDDFGDGWNFFDVDIVYSIAVQGGPVAIEGGNPNGCTSGDFSVDCIGQCLELSQTFIAQDPPECIAAEFSVVTERSCEDFNYDATVTIDEANPEGFPLLIITAELDGVQLDLGQVANLSGQSFVLEDLPLDEDVIITVNVLGSNCPAFEIINVSSIGCPVPLTCGEGLEVSYCYSDNDESIFVYQSPNEEPVIFFMQSGLIEAGFDEIFIYDGLDNTGELLFGGDNGGDLTGVSVTANSGALYMEISSDIIISCQSSITYEGGWNWLVGCGEFDIPGCTDPEALNFSPEANIDDGSCIFPAVNDEPCGALVLECNGPSLTGNFDAASISEILPLPACGSTFSPATGDLWFQFDANGTSTYLISAEESPNMIVALYSGDECGELTLVEDCSDFPESFTGVYEEGTYYFLVRPWSSSTFNNSYTVSLTCVDGAPENDEPCGAIPLVCNEPAVNSTFLGATATLTDACFGSGTADVWFTFESDGETAYGITETSFSDVVINMYTAGECDGELEEVVACQDFPENFNGIYEAGTYFVRVRPWSTAQTCAVSLTCTEPPENDLACGAIELDCESGIISGTTVGATLDEDCGGSAGGAGIWYVFNSDIDGTLRLNTCQDNTDYDSDISIFTGTCDDLTCYAYNDGLSTCGFSSDITVDVFNGTTYYIQVHGWTGEGNFDMEVTCEEIVLDCPGFGNIGDPCNDGDEGTINDVVTEDCECVGTPPPPGTVCGAPIIVDGVPYFDTGNNTSFYGDEYTSANVPPLAPDAIVVGFFSTSYLNGDEVVYEYTPTEDQQIDVVVENIGTSTGLYVFTGCLFESTVGAHTEFAATFREIEALPVTAGVTYYIVVGTTGFPQSTPYDLSIVINVDDCPDLDGDFGDPCDDGDPETVNDVILEDCTCEGILGCFNENQFPGVANDISDDQNELVTISTCSFQTEYSHITGVPAGEDIEFTIEDNGYITVREGAFNGPVVAEGFSPVTVENASGLDLFPHWTVDDDCNTATGCVVTTVQCATCAADCPDGNNIGDPCDDGEDDTINDQITEDCECVGTPSPTTQCGEYTSAPDLDFGTNQAIITDDIEVSGANGTLTDLDVVVVIDHIWTSDVDVRLTSPSGITIDLILDPCGSGDNINVLLDDDSPALTCATGSIPVVFGSFAPTGNLSDFNGEAFNGTWTIEVEDDVPTIDDGTLVSWCLIPTLESSANPACENAMSIVATPEFAGSDADASVAGVSPSGESQCVNADNPQADMWFSFESITTNMYVRAWGLNDFDAAVEVYDACGGELLFCQNDEPAGEREVVQVTGTTVGETYYFRVYHAGDAAPAEQDFTVAVAHIPFTQLSDDDCGVLNYSPADMITTDLPVNQFLLTNWYFEFTELEAPFNTYEVLSPNGANPNFMLQWFTEAEYGRTYEVRTRARMYQGPQWGDYGDACVIGYQANPLTTKLIDEQVLGFYDMCDILEADNVPGAEGYRWKFYDGINPAVIYDSPTRFCQLDLVEGLNLGSPYAVAIRAYTQGILAPQGPLRLIAMNNFVPDTELDENITDCGSTYPLNTVVSAVNICAAEYYTFRFTNITDANQEDLFYTRDDGLRSINLTWVMGLNPGDTYSVQVLGASGGLVGEYGNACEITIAGDDDLDGLIEFNGGNVADVSDVEIELYPNPTTGAEVMLNLSNLSQEQQEVMVEIYDLYGKKVHAEILGNNGSQLNAVISLPELASGIYNVNVVVNEVRVGAKKLVVR